MIAANRQLDCIIAEEIMELEKICDPTEASDWEPIYQYDIDNHSYGFRAFEYSTDMTAAWDVVKKLLDGRSGFILTTVYDTHLKKYEWLAQIEYHVDYTYVHKFQLAETAPEAICLLALQVKNRE